LQGFCAFCSVLSGGTFLPLGRFGYGMKEANMNANKRREMILEAINQADAAVSASLLAGRLGVSRQVIVGDIALLRAQGHEIMATARGYMVQDFNKLSQYVGKIACCHDADSTMAELHTIVDLNATVVNVIVEHEVYGEITGQLNIKNRDDVDIFIGRVKSAEVRLLSELKLGVHLHTIACRDIRHFEQVCEALDTAGFLVQD